PRTPDISPPSLHDALPILSALPPLLVRSVPTGFLQPRGVRLVLFWSLLHTNGLGGPGLECHLVGLLDLRLQSHSTGRGVDDVHHLRKQFRSIGVARGTRELNGPAQ